MKLKLNGLIIAQIKWAKEPNTAIFNKAIGVIRDLEKLYNLDTLSDDEIKHLISKYYIWSPLSSWPFDTDIESISKSILKTNNLNCCVLDTNIITLVSSETKELSYLDVVVYYNEKDKLEEEHIYSYEELQELIQARKIVVETFDWSDKEITVEETNKADLTRENNLPTIDKIDQTNFWSYDDIMLPRIKKRLQKERVNRDILRIINSLRTKLVEYYQRLSTSGQAITKEAPSIQVQEYYDCLKVLNEFNSETFSQKRR